MILVGGAVLFLMINRSGGQRGDNLYPTAQKAAANSENIMETERKDLPEMKNPRLLIKKQARVLEVFDGEKLIKTYKTALGFAPLGDKERQGDGKTPEGDFYIHVKNPKSLYYLSLGISYPNAAHAKRGLDEKLITQKQYKAIISALDAQKSPPQNTALGGDIYIHGGGNSDDWTYGCIALSNEDMKELFYALGTKTPVRIDK